MSLAAGCGAMLQDDYGVVIGVAKASSTSRGGRCVRQDGVVIGAARASSTTRCYMATGTATASSMASGCGDAMASSSGGG
jgi:hypothetical protein